MIVLQDGNLKYEQKDSKHKVGTYSKRIGTTQASVVDRYNGDSNSIIRHNDNDDVLTKEDKVQIDELLIKYRNHEWPGWNKQCGDVDDAAAAFSTTQSKSTSSSSSWLFTLDPRGNVRHKRTRNDIKKQQQQQQQNQTVIPGADSTKR